MISFQFHQLERDLQQVLDEKEELVTERDVYKTKFDRLNQELNYILKGEENRIVDIDALVMDNKYVLQTSTKKDFQSEGQLPACQKMNELQVKTSPSSPTHMAHLLPGIDGKTENIISFKLSMRTVTNLGMKPSTIIRFLLSISQMCILGLLFKEDVVAKVRWSPNRVTHFRPNYLAVKGRRPPTGVSTVLRILCYSYFWPQTFASGIRTMSPKEISTSIQSRASITLCCFPRYLQEHLKQMEEEKTIAMATVSKYKVGSSPYHSWWKICPCFAIQIKRI